MSAIVFWIGAGGVLVRRNPLVILLCIELMLNAANLSLVAFARANGNQDGQIFAVMVMVVAACEVAVGLGLIVAIYRRRLPIDVDELRELQGMSLETCGWMVLLFPLGGTVIIGLDVPALPGRPRLDRDAGHRGLVRLRDRRAGQATSARRRSARSSRSPGTTPRPSGSTREVSILIDPLSVLMWLVVDGRLDADPPLLDQLHGLRPRLRAVLRLPELLRLLHAAAGPGGQLRAADRRLGVRRRGVVPAHQLLVPPHDGDRRRASRPSSSTSSATSGSCSGRTSSSRARGTLDFLKTFERVDEAFPRNDGDLVAGCLLLLVGAFAKSAQVPLHTWLPDAMEGPTPVSALIHAATMVTAGVYLIARMHPLFEQAPAAADVGAVIGCATLLIAATIALVVTDLKRVIAYSTMSQIGYMVMAVSSAALTPPASSTS